MVDNERMVVELERIVARPRYLERIRPFIDVPVVKILTGIRRCGKSTLLGMLADEVEAKHPEVTMVRLNLESQEGLAIRTAAQLLDHLVTRLPDKRARVYVFLDEIQQVPGWEDVVNALRVDWNADIYLTGSNSTMLASQLSTRLAGRYVEFPVRPLAFREFRDLHNELGSPQALFEQYLTRYLKSEGRTVSVDTVLNYLGHCA